MARRLSTKYYYMELDISGQQLEEFISILKKNNFPTEVKVFENGDTELILSDENMDTSLSFRSMGSFFRLEGGCTINNWNLAHLMQKIVRHFKGNALVHRIYEQYTIEYLYYEGKVSHIIEHKDGEERVIYKLNTAVGQLYHSLKERVIEDKIAWIYLQIDQLLDRRLQANCSLKQKIDEELTKLCRELFILEG